MPARHRRHVIEFAHHPFTQLIAPHELVIGPKQRKLMSASMSAIGGEMLIVVLTLSFVDHDLLCHAVL